MIAYNEEESVKRGKGLLAAQVIAAGVMVGLVACGGGSDSPTGPGTGDSGSGSGSPGPSGATITIANGRVTPNTVTISVGQSVTFVNNDGRVRNISSDPHPNHTECPAINAVSDLNNGQTKLTNAFTTARTCGFHNHDDPDNDRFMGQIVIQ